MSQAVGALAECDLYMDDFQERLRNAETNGHELRLEIKTIGHEGREFQRATVADLNKLRESGIRLETKLDALDVKLDGLVLAEERRLIREELIAKHKKEEADKEAIKLTARQAHQRNLLTAVGITTPILAAVGSGLVWLINHLH